MSQKVQNVAELLEAFNRSLEVGAVPKKAEGEVPTGTELGAYGKELEAGATEAAEQIGATATAEEPKHDEAGVVVDTLQSVTEADPNEKKETEQERSIVQKEAGEILKMADEELKLVDQRYATLRKAASEYLTGISEGINESIVEQRIAEEADRRLAETFARLPKKAQEDIEAALAGVAPEAGEEAGAVAPEAGAEAGGMPADEGQMDEMLEQIVAAVAAEEGISPDEARSMLVQAGQQMEASGVDPNQVVEALGKQAQMLEMADLGGRLAKLASEMAGDDVPLDDMPLDDEAVTQADDTFAQEGGGEAGTVEAGTDGEVTPEELLQAAIDGGLSVEEAQALAPTLEQLVEEAGVEPSVVKEAMQAEFAFEKSGKSDDLPKRATEGGNLTDREAVRYLVRLGLQDARAAVVNK